MDSLADLCSVQLTPAPSRKRHPSTTFQVNDISSSLIYNLSLLIVKKSRGSLSVLRKFTGKLSAKGNKIKSNTNFTKAIKKRK